MTNDLREQIGRLLSDVGELVLNTYDVGHFTVREDPKMAHDILMAQADEVLRLMKWAQRDVEIEWAAIEGFSHPDGDVGKKRVLTLPPDDWTP